MDEKYIVYVRADEAERIVEINSSAFLADTAGWTAIDEGYCSDATGRTGTARKRMGCSGGDGRNGNSCEHRL